MVGNTSNRSPSPMSSRPNPNPNSRSINQEKEGVGGRKSFNGYPFVKSSVISQQKGLFPNTPVNSPAEYSRRNSFGRECAGLKENFERDPNIKPAARAKSPSLNTKGTKNFMSPTISAASKISPSPKKKVLGERNEAVRISASLSDGKFYFFSRNSSEFDDDSAKKLEMEHAPCSATLFFDKAENEINSTEPEKFVSDSRTGVEKMEGYQADLVVLSPEIPLYSSKSYETLPLSEMPKMVADNNVGLGIKTTSCSSPCSIAPLDADPSVKPYDPKTNYLSPRPQFLHYNPNRRIGSYVDQGIRLEDDFTSESVTETENTSEEVQSENSQKDQEDAASSVGISDESCPISEVIFTESQLIEENVEAKLEPKSRGFSLWRAAAVLLLVLLGSMLLSVTYYPSLGNAVLGDRIISQIHSDPQAVAELAKESLHALIENAKLWSAHSKESLHDLIEKAKLWSAHSVDYLSQLMQNLRGVDRFGPVIFTNLTGWQEEEAWNFGGTGHFIEGSEDQMWTRRSSELEFAELQRYQELEDFEAPNEMESYTEPENADSSAEELQNGIDEVSEAFSEMQSFPEHENAPEETETPYQEAELTALEDAEPERVQENSVGQVSVIVVDDHSPIEKDDVAACLIEQASPVHEAVNYPVAEYDTATSGLSTGVETEDDIQSGFEDKFLLINPQEVPEIQTQGITEKEALTDIVASFVDVSKTEEAEMISLVTESTMLEATVDNAQLKEKSEQNSVPIAAAVTLVLASLIAAAAFMYMKPKKGTPMADQLVANEKTRYTHIASNMEPSRYETLSSWSGPTEVDMVGESCPSEMSSFQTSSHTKQKGVQEAQSQQKNSKRSHKRESLAASSDYTMTSSYGSFTTYSIMHPKYGDDEVVTPVRRSSRIRSKVTSP